MTTEPTAASTDTTASDAVSHSLPDASAAKVVRAEERLRVRTLTRVRERVVVRKRIVTEDVTRTVTVAREVLEIEHLPANTADQDTLAAAEGADLVELDLVLHEERVVVTTEVVPVERVRVRVHQVTEQVEVAEVLRREQVEVGPATPSATA